MIQRCKCQCHRNLASKQTIMIIQRSNDDKSVGNEHTLRTTICPSCERQESCGRQRCANANFVKSSIVSAKFTDFRHYKRMTANNTSLYCACNKKVFNADNGNNIVTKYDTMNQATNSGKEQMNVAKKNIKTYSISHFRNELGGAEQRKNNHEQLRNGVQNNFPSIRKWNKQLYNCLFRKKFQRSQAIKRGPIFSIRSIVMRVVLLLMITFSCFIIKKNGAMKVIRQKFVSKTIWRLLISLTQFMCILQLTVTPAVGNMLVQKQLQSDSYTRSEMILLTRNSSIAVRPFQQIKQSKTSSLSVSSNFTPLMPQPTILTEMEQTHSTASVGSAAVDSGITKFFHSDKRKRDHLHLEETITDSKASLGSTETRSVYTFNSCSSCHMREKAKHDSLESIKLHILTQLRLPQSPNIPIPHEVPLNIIEDYYRKYDKNGQRRQYPTHRQGAMKNIPPYFEDDFGPMSVQTETYESSENEYEEIKSYEEMMSNDDPNSFDHFLQHEQKTSIKKEDDTFEMDDDLRVNSYFIFPTQSRLRHNKKNEFLNFKFANNEQSTILRTILHLYIRGQKWVTEFQPDLFDQLKLNSTAVNETQPISVGVHRALKRANSFNYTHTIQMAEWRQRIPVGFGKWIQIDLKDLSNTWMDGEEANQVIVIKTAEPWMRNLIVTGIGRRSESNNVNDNFMVYIEVHTERKQRFKRSTSLDCQESDNEVRCCRYPLKVNFTSFGWSFVVAPSDFDAFFCNGECKIGFLEQHTHTHITSLSRSASPCCAPTKMSSLTMLYFNLEQQLALATIPNMTVEKCSCS